MTHRWLVLDLCAPLMAFGGVAIDQVGPTRDFPAASMLVGLFGNALAWHWRDGRAHQALQDRMVFAARLEEAGRPVTDAQNARLYEEEAAWTTFGMPEKRNKGPSYRERDETRRKYITHRRRRDYLADARLLAVIRLREGEGPSLEALAEALDRPARALFIGRKPCLPSRRLFAGWSEGETAHAALGRIGAGAARAQWPLGEGPKGERVIDLPDLRNWITGLHVGSRLVIEGRMPAGAAP